MAVVAGWASASWPGGRVTAARTISERPAAARAAAKRMAPPGITEVPVRDDTRRSGFRFHAMGGENARGSPPQTASRAVRLVGGPEGGRPSSCLCNLLSKTPLVRTGYRNGYGVLGFLR